MPYERASLRRDARAGREAPRLGYRRRALAAAAAFSPSSIAGLQAWYDVSQGAWQDTAGTVACTAGSPVARLDDLSGNGRHATQATAANQPKYGFGTVTDDFSEANGTNLSGKATDTGQTWTQRGAGTFTVSSGTIGEATATNNTGFDVETGMPDCTVQATVATMTTSNRVGLSARLSDANNYLQAVAQTDGSVRLGKFVAAAFTQLAVTATGLVTAGSTVALRMKGASLEVLVNDTVRATASDSFNSTATRHGVYFNVTDGRLDNFSVTSLAGGKPVLVFDGVDDFLNSPSFSVPQPLTIAVVGTSRGGTRHASGVDNGLRLGANADYFDVFAGTTDVGSGQSNYNDADNQATYRLTGGTVEIYKNGSLVASGSPGSSGVTNGWSIGPASQTGSPRVAAQLIYNSALSTTNRQNVENYLKTRFSTP